MQFPYPHFLIHPPTDADPYYRLVMRVGPTEDKTLRKFLLEEAAERTAECCADVVVAMEKSYKREPFLDRAATASLAIGLSALAASVIIHYFG